MSNFDDPPKEKTQIVVCILLGGLMAICGIWEECVKNETRPQLNPVFHDCIGSVDILDSRPIHPRTCKWFKPLNGHLEGVQPAS